jgi:hypothetical protein
MGKPQQFSESPESPLGSGQVFKGTGAFLVDFRQCSDVLISVHTIMMRPIFINSVAMS